MSEPRPPPGFEIDEETPPPPGFTLDADSDEQPIADLGSPLDKALFAQKGDVVDVETPTGPARFDRQGRRVMNADESRQMMDAGGARLKERALEGALSTLSGGGPLVDEMAGAAKALSPLELARKALGYAVGGYNQSPLSTYRSARDSVRRDVGRSTRNASPNVDVFGTKVPILPAIGAAIPSMLAPLPAGFIGRVLSSSAQGAESAAGTSSADLTDGQGAQFIDDVGSGAAWGTAGGMGAEALGAPFRLIGRGAGREAGLASQAVSDATQAAKDKAVRSATGDLGRLVATQGNSMESVMEVLRNPQWFTDEAVQKAYAIAESPQGKTQLSRAALNNLTKLEGGFNAEPGVRDVLANANAAAAPAAVANEVAQKTALPAIAKDVGSKFMRSVGQRAALGVAGSALGAGGAYLTGQDPKTGAAFGATAGFMPQGVLRFARNQAKSPEVQFGANTLMQRLMDQTTGTAARSGALMTPVAESARPSIDEKEREAVQAFLSGG